jgi:excinuclease ABC subunit B
MEAAPLFRLSADFAPAGDQPQAIAALCRGLAAGERFQVLEGVTGSGKTFTMANVIAHMGRPTLIVSHNKTLAAQVYGELKRFFPDNAVEYFVSYYDYYQPEAYIPQTDTYIEKDSAINAAIERLRLSATHALLSRPDVVIVATVSCIYGLGSPADYEGMLVRVAVGERVDRDDMLRRLVDIQYERNDFDPRPGTFRVRGDTVDIFPSYSTRGVRVVFYGDEIESLSDIDTVTGKPEGALPSALISPAKHFVMPHAQIRAATSGILAEMDACVAAFERQGKLLEAQRLAQRTRYDVEMMREIGYCAGIENYSRHLSGRAAGEPPDCLLTYFPAGFLTIIDESHVTLPQLRGMFNGDRARKNTLIEHGFRLPSARDNRPLQFEEFLARVGQVAFASATPGPFEREVSPPPVRQIIRPTGLVEPLVEVRPLAGQIDDLMAEIRREAARGERVLVTTLTKRTAEDLAAYLQGAGLRVEYLHSEVDTVERVDILRRLRRAEFDCLVGINLLREGLDLPEVSLVAILDADKEGFLRSETSLIQTAGRSARHIDGRVILYADVVTESMRRMLNVTDERRRLQAEYNRVHGITPVSVKRALDDGLSAKQDAEEVARSVVRETGVEYNVCETVRQLQQEMLDAAAALEYERAAAIRDEIAELRAAAGSAGGADGGKSPARAGGRKKELRYGSHRRR